MPAEVYVCVDLVAHHRKHDEVKEYIEPKLMEIVLPGANVDAELEEERGGPAQAATCAFF